MRQGKYRTQLAGGRRFGDRSVYSPACSSASRRPFHAPQQRHAAIAPPQHPQAPRQGTSARPRRRLAATLQRLTSRRNKSARCRTIPRSAACRRSRQQRLRQRLQHFSSLPPQQQLRMLNRMETWEHLTPEQKQQARQIFGQMRQLPPDRQRMVMHCRSRLARHAAGPARSGHRLRALQKHVL